MTGRAAPAGRDSPPRLRLPSPRIARVGGIDLRVHPSFWLLVLVVVAVSFGEGAVAVLAALAWLVVVFSSVVVHELAHCFVALRRDGVVREIDLLPIGGVSRMDVLPEAPADELAVAAAGPLASLGLAVVFALAAVALGQPLLPVDLVAGGFVARIAWLNVILAAFNVLPAFPMDGGRMLRAALGFRMDRERATHTAARVARVVAVGMLAVGLLVDVWLLLIGLFVLWGAGAEEAATIVRLRTRGLTAADVMGPHPVVLDGSASAAHAAWVLGSAPQRVYPVSVDGAYVGTVTVADLAAAAAREPVIAVAHPTAAIAPAAALSGVGLDALLAAPGRGIAVVDAGHVVGVLREEDVVALVQRGPADAEPRRHRGRHPRRSSCRAPSSGSGTSPARTPSSRAARARTSAS